jgi:hypothetical protein
MITRDIDQLSIVEKDIIKARIRLAYAIENLGIKKALQFQKELSFLIQIRQILGGKDNA